MAARVIYGLDGGLSAPAGHGGLLRRHAPHPALLAIKPVLLTSHVKSQCLNWSAVPVCRKLPESRRLRCGIEHMAMNAQPELATQNCREPARAAHIAWMGWSRYPRPPRRAARLHLCILQAQYPFPPCRAPALPQRAASPASRRRCETKALATRVVPRARHLTSPRAGQRWPAS